MVKKARVGFNYKGRKIFLEARLMENVNKMLGLMVYEDILLFRFSRGRRAIHSFFCKPFVAVWFLEGKVIEIRKINSWDASISPSRDFDTLIEIPINLENKELVNFLTK